jgi:phosphoribosylaminoimidazole-succinocarboxamide synthase
MTANEFQLFSQHFLYFTPFQEPDNIDKEFLRKWYASHCDPYKDEILPEAPADLINELSRR